MTRSAGAFALATAALLACALGSGCVQRRMVVRSNPPGALVYGDNREIGTTPVATSFIYYGTREIRLVKDGYETLTVKQAIPPPWYEYPPLDFFAENVVPGELRDTRELTFTLKPQMIVPAEQLVGRAERLRRGDLSAGPQGAAPQGLLAPRGAEPVPPGVGGQPVHTLPPGGRDVGP